MMRLKSDRLELGFSITVPSENFHMFKPAWQSDLVGRALDWDSDLCTSLTGDRSFETRQSLGKTPTLYLKFNSNLFIHSG